MIVQVTINGDGFLFLIMARESKIYNLSIIWLIYIGLFLLAESGRILKHMHNYTFRLDGMSILVLLNI